MKFRKNIIMLTVMFILSMMMFMIPLSAETPQTDANSNLPYYITGVERPNELRYSFKDINTSWQVGENGYWYDYTSGVVYWPNSNTGLIDALYYDCLARQDYRTSEQKIRFQIKGNGSESYPDKYIEIRLQSTPYTVTCHGYYETDQVYNLNEFQGLTPGFSIYDNTRWGTYDTLFTKTTFPYTPLGSGGGETPVVKQNIYGSIRDQINNIIFNGEAVQGTIEYNIATLISLICCIVMILLPFLACWAIVRMIFWR